MKKVVASLLAIVFLLAVHLSLAEGVVILSSPDTQYTAVESSLDDMTLNSKVDLGNRIYTLYKADIQDKIAYSGSSDLESDEKSDIVAVWIQVFNFSNESQIYFKDAKVVVTYESERGPFQFGGGVIQNTSSDNYRWEKPEYFYEIDPLYDGYYVFYCYIPNYAANNPGELKMDITTGQETITYYFRR